jgi:hypothetical protein
MLGGTPDDEGYLSIVIGHFIPDRGVSILATFSVCTALANGSPEVCKKEWQEVNLQTGSLLHAYGRADFLATQVLTAAGRKVIGQPYLNEYLHFYSHARPVGGISADEATKVAIDVIESASRLVSLRPRSPAIGGPARVSLLTVTSDRLNCSNAAAKSEFHAFFCGYLGFGRSVVWHTATSPRRT